MWTHLLLHSSSDMGGVTNQGPHSGVKARRDECILPWHAPDVRGGSLNLRHPIGNQQYFNHYMYQYDATNGINILTQVLLRVFKTTDGGVKRPRIHVEFVIGVRCHC